MNPGGSDSQTDDLLQCLPPAAFSFFLLSLPIQFFADGCGFGDLILFSLLGPSDMICSSRESKLTYQELGGLAVSRRS